MTAIEWADDADAPTRRERLDGREPVELGVLRVVEADARAEALVAVERAYVTLANGGRLDVVAVDLRQALERITTRVERQLDTASRVLGIDLRPVLALPPCHPTAPRMHLRPADWLATVPEIEGAR